MKCASTHIREEIAGRAHPAIFFFWAGHTGPIDSCSIYGNKAAGDKLIAMLSLGASKPWPEAMAMLGESKGDASAMLEYYAPLRAWLKEQNKNEKCGW